MGRLRRGLGSWLGTGLESDRTNWVGVLFLREIFRLWRNRTRLDSTRRSRKQKKLPVVSLLEALRENEKLSSWERATKTIARKRRRLKRERGRKTKG
jgi:hypothetical protein